MQENKHEEREYEKLKYLSDESINYYEKLSDKIPSINKNKLNENEIEEQFISINTKIKEIKKDNILIQSILLGKNRKITELRRTSTLENWIRKNSINNEFAKSNDLNKTNSLKFKRFNTRTNLKDNRIKNQSGKLESFKNSNKTVFIIEQKSVLNKLGREISTGDSKFKSYLKIIKADNKKKRNEQFNKKRIEILLKFTFYVFSNIINILAVFNYIMQTFFDDRIENTEINRQLTSIELSFTFYFLFEYILFCYKKNGNYFKHIISIDSFIDMITIIPSIITYFISFKGGKLSFIRVFRIFRVFRILRIYKSLRMIQAESYHQEEENSNPQSKLIKFDPIKLQFITIVVILICVFFIGAGLILGINDFVTNAFSLPTFNFLDATYFMIVTYCTLGYGDILPTTLVTRMMIIIGLFCLFVIVSEQLTKLANLLKFWGPGLIHFKGKDHIIIIADKTINLKLLLDIIIKYKQHEKAKFIIISKDIQELPKYRVPFKNAILINRDDIDFDLLQLISTKRASAIFIFSPKTNYNYERHDKITDFFFLKITQNYIDTPPIYLQTLDSDKTVNKNRTKKAVKEVKNLKKAIPIWKIKSLIISKSTFNPGFATFIQNLFFNDYESPLDIDDQSQVLQNYMRGCENGICIEKLPTFFKGKNFYDAMYIIYFKSINDYFVKINTGEKDVNRPILLIGIYEINNNEENIEIFPNGYEISEGSYGIFITYNENNENEYLIKNLDFFKQEFSSRSNCTFSSILYRLESENIKNSNFKENNLNQDSKDYNDYIKKEEKVLNDEEFITFNSFKHSTSDFTNFDFHKNLSNKINETQIYKIKNKTTIDNCKNENHKQYDSQSKALLIQEINKQRNFMEDNIDFLKGRSFDEKNKWMVNTIYNKFVKGFSNKFNTSLSRNNITGRFNFNNSIKEVNENLQEESKNIINIDEVTDIENKNDNELEMTENKTKNQSLISNKIKNDDLEYKRSYTEIELPGRNDYDLNISKSNNNNFQNNSLYYSKGNEDFYKRIFKNLNNEYKKSKSYENFTNNVKEENKCNLNNYLSENDSNIVSKKILKNEIEVNGFMNINKVGTLDLDLKKDGNCSQNYSNSLENKCSKSKEITIPEDIEKIPKLNSNDLLKLESYDQYFFDKEKYNYKHNENFQRSKTLEEKISLNIPLVKKDLLILNENMINNLEEERVENTKDFEISVQQKLEKKEDNFKPILSGKILNEPKKEKSIKTLNSSKTLAKFKNINNNEEENLQHSLSLVQKELTKRKKLKYYKKYDDNINNISDTENNLKKFILGEENLRNKFSYEYYEENVKPLNSMKKNMINQSSYLNNNENNSNIDKNKSQINPINRSGKIKKDSIRTSNSLINLYQLGFINENNFKNKNTTRNLEFLNQGETVIKDLILENGLTNERINLKANKFYSKLSEEEENSFLKCNKNQEENKLIDLYIFDIEKDDLSKRFQNHIIIIGYQDILNKLLKYIFQHHHKEICIVSTPDSDEVCIHKLLKQFDNLFFFKGSPENPFHLLNAGLNQAYMVIFLTEKLFGKTNEDMQKILIYKSIDYFFNTKIILELWSSQSCRLLGSVPLLKNGEVEKNEFLHPYFMAGRLIYLSHLESIVARSYTEEKNTEVWLKLIKLGINTKNNVKGKNCNSNNDNENDNEGMPIFLTLEIPSIYYDREYYNLMDDLMKLNPPALPVGIYIKSPLEYLKLRSRGIIKREKSDIGLGEYDIVTSHKKKLVNLNKFDKLDKSNLENMKVLRNTSYNNKVFLDIVDLNNSYLPMFITNPHPGFIISSKCKVMVIYYHVSDKSNEKIIHRAIGKKQTTKNQLKKENSLGDEFMQKQQVLKNRQEKIFAYYELLKAKLLDTIEKKYTQIMMDVKKKYLNLTEQTEY